MQPLPPLYYDTHCHDKQSVLSYPRIVASTQASQWPDLLQQKKRSSLFGIALGIHPWFASLYENEPTKINRDLEQLKRYAPQANAIGEIGIDRSSRHRKSYPLQQVLLEKQLEIAQELQKPVQIHQVRGFLYLYQTLKRYPELRGIWHGFVGPSENLSKLLKLSLNFSLGPRFLKLENEQQEALLHKIPLERLHLESDLQESSPEVLRALCQRIADFHQLPLPKIASISYDNSCQIFDESTLAR